MAFRRCGGGTVRLCWFSRADVIVPRGVLATYRRATQRGTCVQITEHVDLYPTSLPTGVLYNTASVDGAHARWTYLDILFATDNALDVVTLGGVYSLWWVNSNALFALLLPPTFSLHLNATRDASCSKPQARRFGGRVDVDCFLRRMAAWKAIIWQRHAVCVGTASSRRTATAHDAQREIRDKHRMMAGSAPGAMTFAAARHHPCVGTTTKPRIAAAYVPSLRVAFWRWRQRGRSGRARTSPWSGRAEPTVQRAPYWPVSLAL